MKPAATKLISAAALAGVASAAAPVISLSLEQSHHDVTQFNAQLNAQTVDPPPPAAVIASSCEAQDASATVDIKAGEWLKVLKIPANVPDLNISMTSNMFLYLELYDRPATPSSWATNKMPSSTVQWPLPRTSTRVRPATARL
jgi:hypothetical protein